MPFHPPRGFRRELLAGQTKIGVLVGSGSTQVVELAAARGLDWVMLDGEHGDQLGVSDMMPLIRAADAFGIPAVIRVPKNDVSAIQQVLDYGAMGICVPHVRTKEDAERAVSYAKYAPQGERAMSSTIRACGYASGTDWNEYWRTANDEVLVMLIVEDRIGMDNIEAIASVPGVDVVWVGTGDLGQVLGVAGVPGPHPELDAAVERGLRACKANGIASFANLIPSVQVDAAVRRKHFEKAYGDGHRLFCFPDTFVIATGFDAVAGVAKAPVTA